MATVMDKKGGYPLCDEVYSELSGMKEGIMRLINRTEGMGPVREGGGNFSRHLKEIADEIDWKLQILAHSCSYDWTGSVDFEGAVQVKEVEQRLTERDFSPGYVGG